VQQFFEGPLIGVLEQCKGFAKSKKEFSETYDIMLGVYREASPIHGAVFPGLSHGFYD